MRLLFRLRNGLAELLEDKKRCRMVSDDRCVMCDNRVGEDVAHFLVGCGEFERDWKMLLEDVGRIVGAGEWTRRDRWHCCWEKWRRAYVAE